MRCCPAHCHPGPINEAGKAALARARAILVSDYGLGVAAQASIRQAVAALTASRPVVWDPHPRGADVVPGVALVTPNASEAGVNAGAVLSVVAGAARRLLAGWRASGVAITLGRRGAVLLADPHGTPVVVDAKTVSHADACGAGDRFAATATRLLATGAALPDAVTGAVAAATEFVSTGGASLVDRVCSRPGLLGGTVGVGFPAAPPAGVGMAGGRHLDGNGSRPAEGSRPGGRTAVDKGAEELGAANRRRRLGLVGNGATLQTGPSGNGAAPKADPGGKRRGPSGASGAARSRPSREVAAPGTAATQDSHDRAEQVAAAVRAAGGTVVAAGGCFDILHAGHVALLQAARAQGDCLIVCLNSDASVRRLKGPRRPVQPEADRAAVLTALECVDAVAVFEEDTPEAVLRRLRPDVFAKGGDYEGAPLPEAAVVADWGGQAVLLPLLEGRSTSNVLKEAVGVGQI